MKKLLMTLGLIVSVGAVCQSPSSSSSSTKETYTTSVSTDDVNSESSITRSSGSYDFDARFDKKKYESVKELIIDELGTSHLQVKGKTHTWVKEKNGREFFSCRLTNNDLHLNLNLKVADDEFSDMIDALGEDLRFLIQKHDSNKWTPSTPSTPQPPNNPNSIDPQMVQNELRQAELELDRTQKRVDMLRKKKNQ